MSSLETRKIEPLSGTTVTLGEAGDTVTAPTGAIVKTNTVKDSGGNTLFTSDGSGTFSSVNSAIAGSMTFISSQTASNSANVDFTSGIDSTYDEYMFVFTDINPASDGARLSFQVNAVGASGFNETMTTTFFHAWHYESDSSQGLAYQAGTDQAQGTAYQPIVADGGNLADESSAGILHLFAPSSTTYAKIFYSITSANAGDNSTQQNYVAGYINVTAAIDAISFKMSGGNFDGIIAMYGIS